MGTKVKSGSLLSPKAKEYMQSYAMILPQLIGLIVFSIYPILWVVKLSWYEFNGFEMKFIGFENFVRAFTRDPYFWQSLANTFIVSFGKLAIELPLALVLAVLLNGKLRGNSIFRTAFFMPTILSSAIIGLVFYFIFSGYDGVINQTLIDIGLIKTPINWFGEKWNAMIVIMLTSIWQFFGLNMIYFLTGLQTIPKELYECGEIDGVNSIQKFFYITIPNLAPMIQVILLLAMIGSMKITDLVLVLTNGQPGGDTEVVMTYIYKQFFKVGNSTSAPDYGYASALGFITAIVLCIMTVVYLKATKKMSKIS